MTPLNILLIHEDRRAPGEGGGAESMLRDQWRAMAARGHALQWWFGQTDISSAVSNFRPDICQVMTIHNKVGMHAVKYLQEHDIPHVWALMDYYPFCAPRMLLDIDGTPCSAVRGVCDESCRHMERITMPTYREVVNGSFVVALNHYTAEIYRRNGVRCDAVVELGVDTELFKPDHSKRGKIPIAMTSSAWPKYPAKGMDTLQQACAEIPVRLVTGQSREAVAAALKESDIYVFPSVYEETWGLSLNEAMASGCACIATDVAGAKAQIEDGVTGLLVPKRDPKAMRDALVRLMHDKRLREKLGANARAHCEKEHSLEAMAKRWEAVYREVLECRS